MYDDFLVGLLLILWYGLYVQVADLKTKIEESREDHGAARQKLIHAGKVLKDEQVISEIGIAEADFIVCMITKEVAKVFIVRSLYHFV